jgi:CubicO group peptidase (beta-lactamase class C family)
MRRTTFGTPALLFLMAALLLPHGLRGQATASPRLAHHHRVAEALQVMEVWLEAQRAYGQIPGLSAALVHDQETVWTGAYGLAHPDRQEPASVETIYSICSISKLFTAIAVMQLRDEGQVALSDPVDRHLPWFDLRQAHPGAPPVTVQGLLTHASGLPRESDHPYWSAPDFEFPTREQIIAGLRNQETLYPAWRYFQYSNLGLSLAGEIVRERAGIPFEEYVQNHILTPLGLAHTRPFMPRELWGTQLATGYSAITRDGDRKPVPFFHARGINPAAGFSSTAPDLARFAAWQFRLQGDAEEVLRAHTLQEMQRVHWVDPGWDTFWGLGFGVYRNDGTTFVGHGGSCPGYRSQLLLQMDDRVAAIVLANASGVDVGQLARGMYGLLTPALKEAAGQKEGDAAASAAAGESAAEGAASGRVGGASGQAIRSAVDLDRYLGTYDAFPWGGETAVVRWKDGLAMLSLPTANPVRALTRLQHVEGHTFRRIRDDDQPGEPIRFDVDPDGRATALLRFENRYPRVYPRMR